jgi:hypothetical protein
LARAASGSLQSSPLLLTVHGGVACCGRSGISTTSVTWKKVAAWLTHSVEHLVCVALVKDRRPQLGDGQCS